MAGSKTPEKKGSAPTGGKPASKAAAKPAPKTSQPAAGKQQTPAAATKKAAAPPTKPAAETVAATVAATSSVADGEENGTLTIPHRYRVDTKRKALVAYCDLPRVPQKYIVCEPTDDSFHVSTPQWSRKYSLTEPYPDGIKVNGGAAEAEFDGKVLQVALPITHFPESAKQKQANLTAAIRDGKQLRFKDEVGKGWKQLQAQVKSAKASEEEAKARAVAAVSGGVINAKGVAPSAIVEEPEEKRTKKSKVFLNETDRVKQLMEAAGEAEADRVASKQQKMTLLQQMRMEAKQAKLEKRTRKAQQQQESVSKVLQQKKRKLEESNPNADKGGKKGGAGGRPAKKAKK